MGKEKPLGGKSYGHIPHLPGSRVGPGDHTCTEGQKRICCEKARDKYDQIVIQEKVDGSNVGVARIDSMIYPLVRSGYLAQTSPHEQHHHFANWAYQNQERFLGLLRDGERLCGEWLMQAHGTRYKLSHEPFVAFDLMHGINRTTYEELAERVKPFDFILPRMFHIGTPMSIKEAMEFCAISGHGALDPVEGAVWRVERFELIDKVRGGKRAWIVDFLAKYVRPDKVDGAYLPDVSGKDPVWNWRPEYR